MIEYLIQSHHLASIRELAARVPMETSAVIFSRTVETATRTRLLSWRFALPEQSDYIRRSSHEAQLSPGFVAAIAKRAKADDCGITFVHSHPGHGGLSFSLLDDEGEAHLEAFLRRRSVAGIHTAIVFNHDAIRGRVLGSDQPITLIDVGDNWNVIFDAHEPEYSVDYRFDRQIRAFGDAGQRALKSLRVGIVGVGGTGSIVAQELMYLGVRNFTLVDPDTVEETNLNRVVGATSADIGRHKVAVAKREILRYSSDSTVDSIVGNVVYERTALLLRQLDVVFGCTDSHGSRMALQQVAYQYLVPCIDMGTTIIADGGSITHISGRVQLISPGRACLTCSGLLDPEEVRRDMMSPEEKRLDPYIVGARQPAPAVISLNSTVASLAVTMLLAMVTRLPVTGRHLLYNALASTVRPISFRAQPNCFICSEESGIVAKGDDARMMLRQDA